MHLFVKGLDFIEVRGLGKSLSGSLFSTDQPRGELLDAGPVLSPELDVLREGVAVLPNLFSQVSDILCYPGKLILEVLGILGDVRALGKKVQLSVGILFENLHLCSDVLLKIHRPGHPVLWQHGACCSADCLHLASGILHPSVQGVEGCVECVEFVHKVFNNLHYLLKATHNLELLSNSLDLLVKDLLLVLGNGDAHDLEVAVDVAEESVDAVLGFVEDILSLSKVLLGSIQVEVLLHFLDLILSLVKACGNSFVVFSVSHPSVFGFREQLQPLLSLVLGVIPPNFNSLDMSLKELGFVWILKDLLALLNQVLNNIPLSVQLDKGLLLPLNELVNILHAGRSNVTGGGEHDAVKELNMGLQLVAVGVALPVQVDHDLGLHDSGDQLFVLLDQIVKKAHFLGTLIFGSLCH